jgi:hypothetical protein
LSHQLVYLRSAVGQRLAKFGDIGVPGYLDGIDEQR